MKYVPYTPLMLRSRNMPKEQQKDDAGNTSTTDNFDIAPIDSESALNNKEGEPPSNMFGMLNAITGTKTTNMDFSAELIKWRHICASKSVSRKKRQEFFHSINSKTSRRDTLWSKKGALIQVDDNFGVECTASDFNVIWSESIVNASAIVNCNLKSTKDGLPEFWAILESKEMRGPLATKKKNYVTNAKKQTSMVLTWQFPRKWLVHGSAIRCRIYPIGRERWWYEIYNKYPTGFYQPLGTEIQWVDTSGGVFNISDKKSNLNKNSESFPFCNGSNFRNEEHGVWLRLQTEQDCEKQSMICLKRGWEILTLSDNYKNMKIDDICSQRKPYPQRPLGVPQYKIYDMEVQFRSNMMCPRSIRYTKGLVWSSPNCKWKTMDRKTIKSCVSKFQKDVKIVVIGDSTVRYFFHSLQQLIEGKEIFSFIGPSHSNFIRSTRISSIYTAYVQVNTQTNVSFMTIMNNIMKSIKNQFKRGANVIYFQLSEAWTSTGGDWQPKHSDISSVASLNAYIKRTEQKLKRAWSWFLEQVENQLAVDGGKTIYIWGSPLANYNGHRKAESMSARIGLPLTHIFSKRFPGRFVVLDRFHSSSLRPEETALDGTHYGSNGGRIIDQTIEKNVDSLGSCTAGGLSLSKAWEGGVWKFGAIEVDRDVSLTHAHQFLHLICMSYARMSSYT